VPCPGGPFNASSRLFSPTLRRSESLVAAQVTPLTLRQVSQQNLADAHAL